MADVARALELPVLLVVGLRLGCLNHALLTHEAIRRDGLRVAGWIGNVVDPGMAQVDANLEWLRERFGEPFALLPWQGADASLAGARGDAAGDRIAARDATLIGPGRFNRKSLSCRDKRRAWIISHRGASRPAHHILQTTADRIEISPHCSLTTRGAWLFFGSVCVTSFSLAGFVALQGFWPVLPFAGLEMALLGWALQGEHAAPASSPDDHGTPRDGRDRGTSSRRCASRRVPAPLGAG